MIDDCNINNLAKNQISAVFHSRAIRRSVSSKFIEICMGRHVGAHPRLKKIKNMINPWKVRGLSIHGKLTIIKAFLLSKMIYPSSVLTTPPCGAFFQVWCILRNVRMSAKCRAFF